MVKIFKCLLLQKIIEKISWDVMYFQSYNSVFSVFTVLGTVIFKALVGNIYNNLGCGHTRKFLIFVTVDLKSKGEVEFFFLYTLRMHN